MPANYDVAIVGSGFGGSLVAMAARRAGRSVILLEKGSHPRIAIGESSTPIANLLIEEISDRYDLPLLRPFSKWGTWQRAYPTVACGLKRGFTFLHHDPDRAEPPLSDRSRQLLVAASPHDGIADTHWYRADFDYALLGQARALGADYRERVQLTGFLPDADRPRIIGEGLDITARLVVDATGPRGFLHRALRLPEARFEGYPETEAVWAHFEGVSRLSDPRSEADGLPHPAVPYPINDAAVHHVFDGGWVWVLQFNNGITSAGIAGTKRLAQLLEFREPECAWSRLLGMVPTLAEQFRGARPVSAFTHIPALPFRAAQRVGRGWAMLPSAAGFVDPLLSTGFPLTLLGVLGLAEVIENLDSPAVSERLERYAAETDADLTEAARLVRALYANMHRFRAFTAVALLYFAAVTFSETAKRLGKGHLAPSFLLRSREPFGTEARSLLDRAARGIEAENEEAFFRSVLQAIEPTDLAGLRDTTRRNWYPAKADDLLQSAEKVEASPSEIGAMLQRSGFYAHG